ncbi:MAG: hypothetical protein RIB71_09050 [Imperialibacter sp.]|uniref:hypothetical protein n=1 Tax=Imperialibacter sp. TaxID=2038411 RepID=UPI0032EEC21F
MIKIDVFDITDWNPHPWMNTGGTRDKKYIQSPNGEYYYFKTSLLRPGKDYKYEFWCEVIAFWLGRHLGFNTLKYDVGIDKDKIGCISLSMIDNDKEDLVEGGKYLQAFDNTFDPGAKSFRNWYSFQLIEETLIQFQLKEYLIDICEVVIFDAIIGNGDRHQENWAFITNLSPFGVGVVILERLAGNESNLKGVLRWLARWYKGQMNKMSRELNEVKVTYNRPKSFAPIYDNGSCLGRELLDHRVELINRDEKELRKYIARGKSEIHWNNKKITHFELIKNISKKYGKEVKEIIYRVEKKYNSEKFAEFLDSLDTKVPNRFKDFIIPENRKELIIKMVNLRIENLKKLIG